jgi:hypothetical protein
MERGEGGGGGREGARRMGERDDGVEEEDEGGGGGGEGEMRVEIIYVEWRSESRHEIWSFDC